MKKILFITLILFICLVPIGFSFSGSGAGTAADPYQITTCLQFNETRNSYASYYKVMNNINCYDTRNWEGGSGWTPIGSPTDFSGLNATFDGNGKVISDIWLNRPTTNTQSVFGYLNSTAIITNLTIYNAYINSKGSGSIIASEGGTQINYVRTHGTVTISGGNGISSSGAGVIKRFSGSMTHVINDANVIINEASSNDSQNNGVGGIVGICSGCTILNSYNTGNITIPNLAFSRDPDYQQAIGGVVGSFYGTTHTLNNTYSVGKIDAGANAGLLCGLGSGGTVGTNYYSNQSSTITNSCLGTAATNASLKLNATYSGWDFSSVWSISETVSYPTLTQFALQSYGYPTITFATPTPSNATNVTSATTLINVSAIPLGNNISNISVAMYYLNNSLFYNSLQTYPQMCYQETANVSTTCGGLSSGNYYFTHDSTFNSTLHGMMYVNYTKPTNALNSSLWTAKYGWDGSQPYSLNISIPYSCWNYNTNILSLAFASRINSNADYVDSFPACYNGSSWVQIGDYSYNPPTQQSATTVSTYSLLNDENWLTYAFGGSDSVWRTGQSSIPQYSMERYAAVYEEAMYWNISTTNNYEFNITMPTQATLLVNATATTDDGLSSISETRTYYVDTVAAPVVTDLAITPSSAYYNDTMTCAYNLTYSANATTNLSWYNGTTLLQSAFFTGVSNSSALSGFTPYKNNILSCNLSVQGGIYTVTNSTTNTILNTLHTINSVTINNTNATIFNQFTIIANISDIDNDISWVTANVTYANGSSVNYTMSLSDGLYNSTNISATNTTYNISIYTDDATNSTNAYTFTVTDSLVANPSPYVATVQAGQNYTFNLTMIGDSSENLTYLDVISFSNASYFNSSFTNASFSGIYNATLEVTITTNASTPDGTYAGNLAITRVADGRVINVTLTLGVATQFGVPYVNNLPLIRLGATSDTSVSQVITINNTGTGNLTSCVPTLTGDFLGWSFVQWSNSSFDVAVSGSKDITLTFASPTPGTYDGYMQVTCTATISGIQNSLSVSNQPDVQLVATQPTVVSGGGGGGGAVVVLNNQNITFAIKPLSVTYDVSRGSSQLFEIQVDNTDNQRLTLQANIVQNQSWITFDGGSLAVAIELLPASGIATSSSFVRYRLIVPDTVSNGQYRAQIKFASGTMSATQDITINVVDSPFTGLLAKLKEPVWNNYPLYQILLALLAFMLIMFIIVNSVTGKQHIFK